MKKHKPIDKTNKLWNQVIPITIYGINFSDELRKRILDAESKYDFHFDDENETIYATIKVMQKLIKHDIIKAKWLEDMEMSIMTIGSSKINKDIRKEKEETEEK